MKIPEVLNLVQADYIDGYKLLLIFDNAKTRVVDFEPFLRQAKNPTTTKYLQLSNFKKFRVVDGNLDWNRYEMCFPIADLYTGRLIKKPLRGSRRLIKTTRHELSAAQRTA